MLWYYKYHSENVNLLDLDNDILEIIGNYVKKENMYIIEQEKKMNRKKENKEYKKKVNNPFVVMVLMIEIDYVKSHPHSYWFEEFFYTLQE